MKILLLLALVACATALVPLHTAIPEEKVEGHYILVFHNAITDDMANTHIKNLSQFWNPNTNAIHHVYSIGGTFRGFAAEMDQHSLAMEMNSPHLAYIQEDQEMEMYPYDNCDCEGLASNLWGLNRVSYRNLQADSSRFLRSPLTGGKGITAYIIDTGINTNHVQFTGRVLPGFNAITKSNVAEDDNGHGTHVAGTVGGATFGVAGQVDLVPVKVLAKNGGGTNAQVIAGIDWVAKNAPPRKSVANMSLGGSLNTATNQAVQGAIDAGVVFVVAAGNSNANACNYSPASTAQAITVFATTDSDIMASFSNYGTCTNIGAPGVNIPSAWIGNTGATNTISGTSMASPHVAGVAALYLAAHPNSTPAQVSSALINAASPIVKSGDFRSSPKIVAYIDCDETKAQICG